MKSARGRERKREKQREEASEKEREEGYRFSVVLINRRMRPAEMARMDAPRLRPPSLPPPSTPALSTPYHRSTQRARVRSYEFSRWVNQITSEVLCIVKSSFASRFGPRKGETEGEKDRGGTHAPVHAIMRAIVCKHPHAYHPCTVAGAIAEEESRNESQTRTKTIPRAGT